MFHDTINKVFAVLKMKKAQLFHYARIHKHPWDSSHNKLNVFIKIMLLTMWRQYNTFILSTSPHRELTQHRSLHWKGGQNRVFKWVFPPYG